jgi:phosphatidylserine/phosphatidylglycerophosphate/cardiolipin synthase-like enzyme
MLTEAQGPAEITVHLLSQIDARVQGKPIAQQASLRAIEAQAGQVAALFVAFVQRAMATLDICIYDFRLSLSSVSQTIVTAINDAAARGVAVRVAYDANEASDEEIIKQFRGAGGDPAPTGTEKFLTESLHSSVETKAIAEQTASEQDAAGEPITAGSHIMHHKYMVADHDTDAAAVWMGSTNFTVDAWALQENNIVVLSSRDLAAQYAKDFNDLWVTENLSGSGRGNQGSVLIGSASVRYAFAPGEGSEIEILIAQVIAAATNRLRVASMVTSSPAILTALKGRIDSGLDFKGVYDYGESTGVLAQWERSKTGAEKVALAKAVLAAMVPKHSQRFDEHNTDRAHNFMHNKVVVADDTIVTGSFNFSANAAHNAENILAVSDSQLADAYAGYIDSLAARYQAAG